MYEQSLLRKQTRMVKRETNSNLKYLTRLQYYGKLIDWEFVGGDAMVLKLAVFAATEYFGGSSTVRLYVPTNLQRDLTRSLFIGDNYFVIAAPYKVTFKERYRHRVDLLLNIFKEVI